MLLSLNYHPPHLCALMAAIVSTAPPAEPVLAKSAGPSSGTAPLSPSPAAEKLWRPGGVPCHAPDGACSSSGSEGVMLLVIDTKDASDLCGPWRQQQRQGVLCGGAASVQPTYAAGGAALLLLPWSHSLCRVHHLLSLHPPRLLSTSPLDTISDQPTHRHAQPYTHTSTPQIHS